MTKTTSTHIKARVRGGEAVKFTVPSDSTALYDANELIERAKEELRLAGRLTDGDTLRVQVAPYKRKPAKPAPVQSARFFHAHEWWRAELLDSSSVEVANIRVICERTNESFDGAYSSEWLQGIALRGGGLTRAGLVELARFSVNDAVEAATFEHVVVGTWAGGYAGYN